MEKNENQDRRPYVAPAIMAQPLAQVVRGEEGSHQDYFAERALRENGTGQP